MNDYEPDRHAEDEDRRLLEEYDANPENFRPVIETPRTKEMRLRWRESYGEPAAVDEILDSHAELERKTVLLRRQRDRLEEALRDAMEHVPWTQRKSADHALALIKQFP